MHPVQPARRQTRLRNQGLVTGRPLSGHHRLNPLNHRPTPEPFSKADKAVIAVAAALVAVPPVVWAIWFLFVPH